MQKVGILGYGYNIISGTPTQQLVNATNAEKEDKASEAKEKTRQFKSYRKYRRLINTRVGIDKENFPKGTFSQGVATSPLLGSLTNSESQICMFYEKEIYSTRINLDPAEIFKGIKSSFLDDKDVKEAFKDDYSYETRQKYFKIIKKYGTHLIKALRLGARAEMWCTWNSNSDTKASREADFNVLVEEWKKSNYKIEPIKEEPVGTPKTKSKNTNGQTVGPKEHVEKLSTINWETVDKIDQQEPARIGFKVMPISDLLEGRNKEQFEKAVLGYLEYHCPANLKSLQDETIISILCLESRRFLRINSKGNVRADAFDSTFQELYPNSILYFIIKNGLRKTALEPDTHFVLKKRKGVLVSFKSVQYGKLISKGITRPHFRFHLLQKIGPHESFKVNGDYIKICGHVNSKKYVYVSKEDSQLYPDGNINKKSRFGFLPLRSPDNTILTASDHQYQELFDAPSPPASPSASSYDLKKALSSVTFEEGDIEIAKTKKKSNGETHEVEIEEGSMEIYPKFKRLSQTMENPKKIASPPKKISDRFKLKKYNSTSSLYVKDTINLPDIDDLTRCLSIAISRHVKTTKEVGKQNDFNVFDETENPIDDGIHSYIRVVFQQFEKVDLSLKPDEEIIYVFVNTIFRVSELSPECAILCLAFLERLGEETGLMICPANWRRVLLSTIMLASKVWEEQAVWNADFLEHFPKVEVHDLNNLEKNLLKLLEYNVGLSGSLYAKYYFDLRQLSLLEEDKYALKQLSAEQLKKLEDRINFDDDSESQPLARSVSMFSVTPKTKPVILN